MGIHNFLKKTKAFNIFAGDVKNETLCHAYIISGKDALTVKSTVELFACALLCDSRGACLNCNACQRVLKGVHPDFTVYPSKGDKISVEDIDSLTGGSSYRPAEGDCKVYALLNGETMNTQSQNKLLKTFEEPEESTYIIIGTLNLYNLLPTVKSRAKIIETDDFTKEQICGILKAELPGNNNIETAAAAGGGLIGKSLEMAQDGEYINLYNYIYNLLGIVKDFDGILPAMRYFDEVKDKNRVLDIMLLYIRDCLMVKTGGGKLVFNKKAISAIQKEICGCEEKSIISLIENINAAKRKLLLNCSPQAVLETLLMQVVSLRQNGGINW